MAKYREFLEQFTEVTYSELKRHTDERAKRQALLSSLIIVLG